MTTTVTRDDARLADFGYDEQLRQSLSLGDLLIYGLVFIVPMPTPVPRIRIYRR